MNLLSAMIGASIALFGIYIAQRTGFLHISIARKAHDLNVTKAVPKIGSSIEVDERYDNGPHYPAFLYLTTTIYNEGELPISKLNGEWKLTAFERMSDHRIPIQREFLGSNPYQLKPFRITQSGTAENNRFVFDIDIDFDYIGISPDKPDHYSAKYRYECGQKRMNRV